MPKTANADVKEIVRLRNKEGLSWAKIAEAVGVTPAQAMLMYGEADKANAITGTDDQIKKEVAKQRKAGLSWGLLMGRSGKGLQWCRNAYEEITGNDPLGDTIGRGGRTPGSGVNGAAKKVKKAVKKAAKKAPAKAVKKATKKAPAAKKAAAKRAPAKKAAKKTASSEVA